jgi:hypothetical protein
LLLSLSDECVLCGASATNKSLLARVWSRFSTLCFVLTCFFAFFQFVRFAAFCSHSLGARAKPKKKKKKKKKKPVFSSWSQDEIAQTDANLTSPVELQTSMNSSTTVTSQSSNSDAPKLTKTSWRGSQTIVLVDAVTVLGDCNWRQVAQYIPSKTAAQCAQQWAR